MSMKFEYEQTTKICFGRGKIQELPRMAAAFGHKVLLVTSGKNTERKELYDRIIKQLEKENLSVVHYDGVVPNPTTQSVDRGAEMAKRESVDVILGVGGGSVMDSAKAIAVAALNPGSAWDYLFFKSPQPTAALPVIAVPTTSGTGSQVTQVAVMTESVTKTKSAIFHPIIFPKVAVIDPDLMTSMPSHVTASTGFDAFCHCFESYLHVNGSPYTDMIALEGMKHAAAYLRRAVRDGGDAEAREGMAWADTCGGLAIANAGVTLPHGIGMTISGHCPHIMHGESLALIYPSFLRFTLPAAVEKFAAVGRILNPGLLGAEDEKAAAGCCEEIERLLKEIGMWIGFKQLEVDVDTLKKIADRSHDLPDYKSNPRIADKEEIYKELLEGYERA